MLVSVLIVDGPTVARFVDLEAVMRPEGVIIVEGFLLPLGIDDRSGLAVHLDAQSGPQLLLPLIERPHPHSNLHAHNNNFNQSQNLKQGRREWLGWAGLGWSGSVRLIDLLYYINFI